MTEAIETIKPLQLTNRFQPLLQIPMYDDVCISQPMLTGQTKTTLEGKKNNKRVRGAPKGGLRTQETRLATALIKFRNKERNVRLPT